VLPRCGYAVDAVVFDLLYTLAIPGTYPGGADRIGWLSGLLGIDERELRLRWEAFEPRLETGSVPSPSRRAAPEIDWIASVAASLGSPCSDDVLDVIDRDWDLTRREALSTPHPSAMPVLQGLRQRGIRVGVLSNTHAAEVRTWPRSPLSTAVDAVAFSHDIGCLKPDPAAYATILDRLGTHEARSVFVGDGGSDELAGARDCGFALVVLAEEAPRRLSPDRLPELRRQSHASVQDLAELLALVDSS